MHNSSPELDLARAQHMEAPADKNTERVYKMFDSAERIEVIKASPVTVKIGSGPEARSITIRPMNPRQLIASYALINAILIPVLALYGRERQPAIGDYIGALGENIDKLPDLIYEILKRGNDVSKDWIMDNLDIALDCQQIIPIFLEQNGLGKLLGKGRASDVPTQVAATSPEMPQQTAE